MPSSQPQNSKMHGAVSLLFENEQRCIPVGRSKSIKA